MNVGGLTICGPHAITPRADDAAHLTAAIAAGDTEAFTRFYRQWFPVLYADARRATGRDEAFCLDVVHDAMLRVIRSMRPLPTEADLRRWLRVVVRSCAYDRLRAESRRVRHERAARDARPATAATEATDLDGRLEWLRRELRDLDDRSVQLLVMRHRLGWTLARIGRVLGLAPGAVDGKLRRIVARLRRHAAKEDRP
ncbi:MAG: RNA polymerase sigma factor [Planctomycetota bacterium]